MNELGHTLQSDRLIMRNISENDTEKIVKWRSDPDVYKYFKFPHKITKEEHLNWYFNSYLKDENRLDCMGIDKNLNLSIGLFGIKRIDDKIAEISYLVDKAFRGRGYAAEGVDLLTDWALSEWKTKKIIAEINKENIVSIRFVNKMKYRLSDETGDFLIYEKDLQ